MSIADVPIVWDAEPIGAGPALTDRRAYPRTVGELFQFFWYEPSYFEPLLYGCRGYYWGRRRYALGAAVRCLHASRLASVRVAARRLQREQAARLRRAMAGALSVAPDGAGRLSVGLP